MTRLENTMLTALEFALRRLEYLGSEETGPCESTEAVRHAIKSYHEKYRKEFLQGA